MEKIDFKKDLKSLYKAPVKDFVLIDVPSLPYLMVDGAGDPNTVPEFQSALETLYAAAYTIKFTLKRSGTGPEYSVAPLSGLWWCEGMEGFDHENREKWRWTVMIPQPPHIGEETLGSAVAALAAKGKKGPWDRIRLETYDEGLCVQTMHIGPYCDEGPLIAAMHGFIADRGYSIRGKHHEIYMSDPRRTAREKLKTILRQPVSK